MSRKDPRRSLLLHPPPELRAAARGPRGLAAGLASAIRQATASGAAAEIDVVATDPGALDPTTFDAGDRRGRGVPVQLPDEALAAVLALAAASGATPEAAALALVRAGLQRRTLSPKGRRRRPDAG